MDVLVVDPGELGELLATLLEQYGFTVERATSGEEALGRALHQRPSVLVVEATLKDTSGLDLAELLRDELGCHTLLTHAPTFLAEADADVPGRVRQLDGTFLRPFRSLSLIERVAELLGRPISRPGAPTSMPQPLSSTEGYAVDELAEAFDGIDIVLDDEVPDAFELEPFEPENPGTWAPITADDDIVDVDAETIRKAAVTVSISQEAARPLDEVLSEEQRRHTQTFSPGDLADLWHRVKARRTTQPSSPSSSPSSPSSIPASSRPATAGALSPRLLADLLDAFHQSQTTGELWLADAKTPGRRVLLLQRGVLVGARSNIEGEDLVSLLRKRKAIADEDADAVAFMLSQQLYKTAAEAILALDHVPARVLRSVVEEHVRRVAIGAFAWSRGRYQLTLEGRATKEPIQAAVHVGDVVVHAIILTESDDALRKAAPDDARFAPVGDAAHGLEHLHLSPQEARVVIAMDGTKTIGDLLALHDQMPERAIRGLAAGLFCLHLTRFQGRGPAKARNISFF